MMSPRSRLDEREALRLPVVALPDHLDVQVSGGWIDVLRRLREDDLRDLRICAKKSVELRDRLRDRRLTNAPGDPGVDHDRRRGDRPRAHGVAQDVEALDGLQVSRDPLVGPGPELEREHRKHEQDEEPGGRERDELRVAHDEPRQDCPESALVVGAVLDPALREEPHPVEWLPDEREHDRQERGRCENRYRRDDQAAHAEPADERKRHEQQHRQADRDCRSAEDDRAPRCSHGRHDRLVARGVASELLAKAVHDQEGVVDRDAEADERDQVREVRGQLHEVGEDPDDPERGGDRHDREREREQERERPEREDEDQERDRDRDHLALREVLGEHGVEVVLDRGLAGEEDLRSLNRAGRPAHVVRPALGVRGLDVRDDLRRDHVAVHRGDRHDPAGRKLRGRSLGCRAHLRNELLGVPLALDDERERAGRPLTEVILEDHLRPTRVGTRKREAVGEEAGELGRCEAADEEGREPPRQHEPAVAEDEARQRFHAASRSRRCASFRCFTPGTARTAANHT